LNKLIAAGAMRLRAPEHCIDQGKTLLVSILINSYNYERFVAETIRSALAQTYRPIEVIVVDDGSSDGSWQVIESFGHHVRSLRQTNGGQGAAYNAGFAMSRGEYLVFLDSDDLLDARAVERCVASMQSGVAKVQFRMRLINQSGAPAGGAIPYVMHDGDVRPIIRQFGHYAGPPGSGNLYRRSALTPWFPIEPGAWRRAADTLPFLLSAFCGRVVSIDQELGSYRLHQSANQSQGLFGNIASSYADVLSMEAQRISAAIAWLKVRSGVSIDSDLLLTPTHLRTRALSLSLAPQQHPFPLDSRWSLIAAMWRSLARWPGHKWADKCAMMLWTIAVTLLPPALVRQVARLNTAGAMKAWIRRANAVRTRA
jgi:Glycosyl transferase family 2